VRRAGVRLVADREAPRGESVVVIVVVVVVV
jgi:hypothetical protein